MPQYSMLARGNALVKGNLTVLGTESSSGNITLGDSTSDTLTINATVKDDILFEKEDNHTIDVNDTTTAATAGGNLVLGSGAGSTSGAGGAITATAGAGGATGAGGPITITAGAGGATSGAGGATSVVGGAATAGNSAGGAVAITGGAGQGTSAGGAITATSGAGENGTTGTAGASGAVTVQSGAGGTATTGTGGAGGTVSVVGAAGGATSGAGGTGGAGADIAITAGAGGADGEGASGTGGAGGDITLTPGAGGAGNTAGAQGQVKIAGPIVTTTITTSSGAGAVGITGALHEVTTTGTGDALTLANGTAGQRLSIIYVAEGAGGDTAVITPTTLAGGTTITLNALGDSADLVYSSTGGWYVLGLGGSAAVA